MSNRRCRSGWRFATYQFFFWKEVERKRLFNQVIRNVRRRFCQSCLLCISKALTVLFFYCGTHNISCFSAVLINTDIRHVHDEHSEITYMQTGLWPPCWQRSQMCWWRCTDTHLHDWWNEGYWLTSYLPQGCSLYLSLCLYPSHPPSTCRHSKSHS